MVVVMEERATEEQIAKVVARLVEAGMDVHRSTGVSRTVLGVVGQKRPDSGLIEMMDGVHEVMRISEPYKLASRTFKPEGTVITIGDVRIGGDEVIVMAGPCSAETDEQCQATAAAVRKAGAKILPRRRVQAAQLAVQLPGPRRRRPAHAARRGEGQRHAARHRSDGRQPDRPHRQVRRHLSGRRAQHAELHPAQGTGHRPEAGAAQARPRRRRSKSG